MKIFARGNEPAKPASQPTVAAVTTTPTGASQAAPAPAPASGSGAAPSPAGASAPAGPPNPDLTAIIEANVKEMSEKIARLASTIEGDHNERSDFENKIEKMEERMRKLSSLTEMISAQYNPFVGAAPAERDSVPAPDVGLAAPPLAAPPLAAPAPAAASAPAPQPLQIALDDPFASVAQALEAAPPAPTLAEPMGADAAPLLTEPPMQLDGAPLAPAFEITADEGGAAEAPEPNDVRLYAVKPSFGSSMLMLSWADMLLKHAPSREGVAQVLEYYRNVGWIGEPARDQILAYVDGIDRAEPESGDGVRWRAPVEVHEKSLLFIEKLRAIGRGQGQ